MLWTLQDQTGFMKAMRPQSPCPDIASLLSETLVCLPDAEVVSSSATGIGRDL